MNVLLLTTLAWSAPAPEASATVLSLDTSGVMGFATLNVGRMGLVGEHVIAGQHGIVLEAGVIHLHGDPSHLWSIGGALGYRLHLRGATNAPFVGVRLAVESGFGRYVTDRDAPDTTADDVNVPVSLMHLQGTAQVGYRWNLVGRLELTYRVGAGYGYTSIQAKDGNHAFAEEAEWFSMDRFQRFPFVVDTELSVGVRLGG